MSQCETVLKMLQEAGERGVSSRRIYNAFIGRPGARIDDLKKAGHAIEVKERDPADPKFVIYTLVGTSAGTQGDSESVFFPPSGPRHANVSAGSSERQVPSMFDCDEGIEWRGAA